MKTIIKTVLVGIALTIIACDSVSSPKGVVEMAGRALREGNDKKFLSTLSIEYRREYQNNPEAISALRQRLAVYSDLMVGTVRENPNGTEVYDVPVLGKVDGSWTEAILAYVSCETREGQHYEPGHGDNPGHWESDSVTTCEIDGLK